MRTRGRSRWAAVVVTGAVTLLLVAAIAVNTLHETREQRPAAAVEPPNVVVLMTDDQTLEMMRVMPRTQRLIGAAGVTFANYYVSYPLCCPSRATYLTGQYAHNNGVAHNGGLLGGYERLEEMDSLPVWMQKAGYVTSHIGKYPNGYGTGDDKQHIPLGWDEWRGAAGSPYRMWGYELNEQGAVRTYGERFVEDPELYQTDVYADKAVDFIERRSGKGAPFFLSVAFVAPHSETPGIYRMLGPDAQRWHGKRPRKARIEPGPRPAPRHRGRLADLELPRSPAFDEADVSDKPWFIRDYPRLTGKAEAAIERSHRQRLESLLAVDEAVEKIVRALGRTGELHNTYVLFVSDNGYFFGEHRVPGGKFLPYEAGTHVPLLLRGPDIPAGEVSRELVTNTDLAATIVDIAGARATVALDGRSLLPLARHPSQTTGRPILHEGGGGAVIGNLGEDGPWGDGTPDEEDLAGKAAARGDLDQDLEHAYLEAARRFRVARHQGQVLTVAYEAIRTQRYLYVRYLQGAEELYDLAVDPDELRSVHDDPGYAGVRAYLRQQLARLQDCQGDECNREIAPAPEPVSGVARVEGAGER